MTIVNKKISPHTLFNTNTDSSQHFRLFLDDIIHDGAQIHDILNSLHDAGDGDTLEIRVNSGGGFVKYGHQFINVIKGKFAGRCLTIIESDAYSMASLIFMAGDRRIVYEHSSMMVHDIGMYLEGKASESKKQLEAATYVFKNKFISLFKDCLSDTEIDEIFKGQDKWFNAEEMCERGMATHVLNIHGDLIDANDYLFKVRNPLKVLLDEKQQELQHYNEVLDDLEERINEYSEKVFIHEKDIADLKVKINENSSSREIQI